MDGKEGGVVVEQSKFVSFLQDMRDITRSLVAIEMFRHKSEDALVKSAVEVRA
jgi:hypothetical protein